MAVVRHQRVGFLFCATLTCLLLVITSFYAWSSHLKKTSKTKNQQVPPSIPLVDYLDAAELADSVSPLWSESWYSVTRNNHRHLGLCHFFSIVTPLFLIIINLQSYYKKTTQPLFIYVCIYSTKTIYT